MRMRTLLLLDVPKTHMSRHERVVAFKERNGIWTYRSDLRREDDPWCAMLEHRARKALAGYLKHDEADDPIALIAGYCRLLEECGLLVTGVSEREAIRRLCERNRMGCAL
jgi:hypothetical protein